MAYLVIARKWRPQAFEEVVGQGHVTRTLQNAISAGRVGHGYLFTGPRGVGKTTTARILAKALNCAEGPTPRPCGKCDSCREVSGSGSVDVMEIDGASNNSVEDIRALREKVLYSGVRDRHKVYIIDEVHMLSQAAFNALLKTLEEPPPHVIFIFATTEVQKIPATILSRTQRFDFRRVGNQDLSDQLKKILDAENIPSTPDALGLIARAAGGSVRDSQTLLDQVISFSTDDAGKPKSVSAEAVTQVLGGVQESQALGALRAALQGDLGASFAWIQELYEKGAELRQASATVGDLLRGMLLLKSGRQGAAGDLLPETSAALSDLAQGQSLSRIMRYLTAAADCETQMRFSANPRLALEMFFTRLRPIEGEAGLGELFDELGKMEKRLSQMPAGTAPVSSDEASSSGTVQAVQAEAAAVEEIAEADPMDPFESLKADWEKVIGLAQRHSPTLSAAVKDLELVSLMDDQLNARASNDYVREMLSDPGRLRGAEVAIENIFGKPVRLVIEAAPERQAADKDGKPDPKRVEELMNENATLKKAADLFGAEIVSIDEN